jgi:hypothetical protein
MPHLEDPTSNVPSQGAEGQSVDYLDESAYLVERGVRLIAIAGNCRAKASEMGTIRSQLGMMKRNDAIAFMIDEGDGIATYGYGSHSWAIDLLRWALIEAPMTQKHRIIGLLLGYSGDAIRHHEELSSGDLFRPLSPRQESSPRPSCTSRNLETHAPGVL